MARVITRVSQIALRERWSAVFTRICVTTANKLCDRKLLVCSRSSMGSASMMRSMVLDGRGGVQRAQHQVAGFRGGHRHGDGFGVAQFADQDHVGIFAHGGAHAFGERRNVRAELALDDLRLLAAMDELDRVFERDDVEPARGVQVVDHRRERGRLAGAGGAGDQHHALVVVAELLDDRWQRQLVDARDVLRNRAERGAEAGFLAVHVDAEAAAVGRHVGEVEVVALAEVFVLVLGEDLGEITLELRVADVAELDGHEVAVHAQHGRHADGQVHVGAALLHAKLQERIYAGHGGESSGYVVCSPKHATVRRASSVTQCAILREPRGDIPHFLAKGDVNTAGAFLSLLQEMRNVPHSAREPELSGIFRGPRAAPAWSGSACPCRPTWPA